MKPVIATFVSYYLPGYKAGGPLQSIANLVDRLEDEFDFRIVTSNHDLGEEASYPDVPAMNWVPVGKAQVMYLPEKRLSLGEIASIINNIQPDALYLNSFFDRRFTILPLLARRLGRLLRELPVVLAPRGEFSEGALRLKRFKKKSFLLASRLAGMYSGLVWHASTRHEASDIRATMGEVDIMCAVDLPRRLGKPSLRKPRREGDPLRVAFLSRLSPMKNLLYALDVLAKVRTPTVFTIYGPREDEEYWRRCAAAIAAMPPHVEVIEAGPIHHSEVVPTLALHDLFFLPTLGENYGHVFAEALEAGLRLLISDQTPWLNLAAAGVGYDLPLGDPDAFVRAIETEAAAIRIDDDVLTLRNYLESALNVEETVEANRALFLKAVDRRMR